MVLFICYLVIAFLFFCVNFWTLYKTFELQRNLYKWPIAVPILKMIIISIFLGMIWPITLIVNIMMICIDRSMKE